MFCFSEINNRAVRVSRVSPQSWKYQCNSKTHLPKICLKILILVLILTFPVTVILTKGIVIGSKCEQATSKMAVTLLE